MQLPGYVSDVLNNFGYLAMKYRGIPAVLMITGTAIVLHGFRRRLASVQPLLAWAATFLAAAILVVEVADSVIYLTRNGYYDHVEPSIAAVARWYSQGHPLYPDWASGQGIYGWQYGPLVFQIEAAALAISPTILASKLPSFACFWLTMAAVFAALRPAVASKREAAWTLSLLLLINGSYFLDAFWVRSDPELMLLAALGLLAWRRFRPYVAAAGLGIAAGCLVNLKIHAVLYVAPYGAALLAGYPGSHLAKVRLALVGLAVALLAAALPFLDANVTVRGYASFLRLALHHGLDRPLLLQNARLACLLLLPVPVLVWRHRRDQEMVLALAYAACVAVVAVIGGKKGAGPTHLLPFLPLFLYQLIRAVQALPVPHGQAARSAALAATMVAATIGVLPSFIAHEIDAYGWMERADKAEYRAEAEALLHAYPDAVMGAGDDRSYVLAQYKVLPVLAGAPMVFDASTWMDVQGAGLPDDAAVGLLTDCRVRHWIIPDMGEPFTQRAAYSADSLFSDRFRLAFHQAYDVERAGRFYKVWGCKGGQSQPRG